MITPIITGKVESINGTAVTLKDLGFGQTAFKVGSTVAILPEDLDQADSKKVKAIPNALTPYDIVKAPDAISVDGDGMYKNDRPVLERRMPAINQAIKDALLFYGCQFKWSNRK